MGCAFLPFLPDVDSDGDRALFLRFALKALMKAVFYLEATRFRPNGAASDRV